MGIGDPDTSGLLISNIEGLGPGDCDINVTDYGAIDGAMYNSSRKSSRNIVIDIIFMGNPTIEESRQLSYKYFHLKSLVTLDFITDTHNAAISGYVESNEPNIFDKQEGTSISIICPNPYFREKPHIEKDLFSSGYPLFEFPFSNESLTEPLIEFSEWKERGSHQIFYEGNVETGVFIHFYPSASFKTLTISNATVGEKMVISGTKIESIIGKTIKSGDVITLSTVDGNKKLTYTSNNAYSLMPLSEYTTSDYVVGETTNYNVLNALDFMGSDWIKLYPGYNVLFCSFNDSSLLDSSKVYIEYDALLEGI